MRLRPMQPALARPLVILLHGFGSFWWSWRHQLCGLTGARVVAVDLRGYGGSDKPPRGYDGWTLAGDTAGLIRALGHPSATLVGHADGGLACWTTALLHSRLVRAIALISSPHPAALRRSTLTRRDQRHALLPTLLRYQLPIWPERLLTRNNAAEIERLVRARGCAKWLASEDFASNRPPSTGDPDPGGGALRTRVPALGGAQPAAQRRAAIHQGDDTATGDAAAALTRRRRPLRAGRPGRAHPALRTTRAVHIHCRRRTFQSRRGAGGSQPTSDAFPRAGAPAQLTQAPVPTGWVAPILASCPATSPAVSTNPVSASSTAAPNTTPST